MTAEIPQELQEAYDYMTACLFHEIPIQEVDLESVVAEDAMCYGTTIDENIFGVDEFNRILKLQADQMQGLEINIQRKTILKHAPPDGMNGIFVEEVGMQVRSGEVLTDDLVRMSFIMEKRDGIWKLIHGHGSKPVETEQDFWHVNEWKAVKEKLEKKVAEQTEDLQRKNWELEIEAASERVRAVAMGMQHPDDILGVLRVVKEEIDRFELGNISTWMWTVDDEQKVTHWELADLLFENGFDSLNMVFDAEQNALTQKFIRQMGDEFFSFSFAEEYLFEYLKSVSELSSDASKSDAGNAFADAIESGKIKTLWQQCSTFSSGLIGLMFATEPPEEVRQIIIKITEAFGLAYKRFKDLQDAEQRRRDAELEAAVERVRTHAMGMQQPDDIMNVLNVIKEELYGFELENIGTWFWIFNDDNTLTQWDISETGAGGSLNNINITVDLETSIASKLHGPKWHTEEYYNLPWRETPLQHLIDEIKKLNPEGGHVFQELVDNGKITTYWQACAPFSRGVLGLDYAFEPPVNVVPVLKKMGSAFDMAYQRFEDLQKAEAQARESKIEAALERIRSQSLAMQSSDELRNVADVLYEQMRELGQPLLEGSAIHFYEKHEDDIEAWFTMPSRETPTVSSSGKAFFPKDSCWVTKEWIRKYQSNEEAYDIFTSVEQQEEWIDVLKDNASKIGSIASMDDPQPTHMHFVDFSGGALAVVSLDPVSEDTQSLQKRAAAVFDFAYRRYEDLRKAEQQAYESKVEASLERLRGMASAMNHSDDLMQIAEEMFKEMEILKINPLRYGLGMIDAKTKVAELWASTVNDGHYLDMMGTITLTWHPMLRKVFDAWDAQHEEMIYELKGEERSSYYQKIGRINPDIPNLEALRNPETDITEFVSFFPFKSGALYAFTTGEPNADGRSILKRFASVFEQAHIRYNDLQTAEKQARQIREERDRLADTLKELRAAQDQLVQQEKLASLGQLTAGIAHEIKNPLNFVNNFSDLSLELVEEIRQEIRDIRREAGGEKAKGKRQTVDGRREADGNPSSHRDPFGARGEAGSSPQSDLILDILDDIEANLKTIHKHGTRADGIVKSMLQHSRGGDGKLEPTPLNPLIKEYVNLAFHGMRAGSDPINVDIDLQLDKSVGEVPLIAEDFSRVILNLTNNAFDAMRTKLTDDGGPKTEKNSPLAPASRHLGEGSGAAERSRGVSALDDYHPKLTVRTRKEDQTITLEIEDNGPGIPDDIKDKILQPFFTTKKGTAGTGLGLSITNDIIKAHGGSIGISSSEGVTIFSIILFDNQ